MDVTSVALSGVRAAAAELKTAATNTANANTPGFKEEEVTRAADANGGVIIDIRQTDQEVDLAEQSVKATIASYDYQANLKVLQKQQELDKSLLDIQA